MVKQLVGIVYQCCPLMVTCTDKCSNLTEPLIDIQAWLYLFQKYSRTYITYYRVYMNIFGPYNLLELVQEASDPGRYM